MRPYSPRPEVAACMKAEMSIRGMEMESIGGMHMELRDELFEDFMFFNGPERFAPGSILRRAGGFINTPRTKSFDELTPSERVKSLRQFWKETDKRTIRAFNDNSAGGGVKESPKEWAKRMGLESPKNRDQRRKVDWPSYVNREEAPTPSEITWIFGHLYDPEMVKGDEGFPENLPTDRSMDMLMMSWPAQRTFRWNDPEAYRQWVEDLKEEMGPWFDESLVLPEYKFGERVPKAREVEDLDPEEMFECPPGSIPAPQRMVME